MGKLDGKVAIVTGGARGQGAAHARRLVSEGAKVMITDILEEEGKALTDELGDNAKFMKHDVTSEERWMEVVAETEATFGPVNILVNNAGIVMVHELENIAEAEYRKVIDINQVGVLLGMKSVIPSMKKAGSGSIINISSINGLRGGIGTIAYDASKFAVRGMTKTAANELAKYNIRVNSVHPGVIDTPMVATEETKEQVDMLIQTVPMKRMGQPDEVSRLIVFLASDDSSYCTGSEFTIDGGVTASN